MTNDVTDRNAEWRGRPCLRPQPHRYVCAPIIIRNDQPLLPTAMFTLGTAVKHWPYRQNFAARITKGVLVPAPSACVSAPPRPVALEPALLSPRRARAVPYLPDGNRWR